MKKPSLLLLAAISHLLISSLAAQETPPNIIFLLADDQATISMGCYGNSEVQTPNLDQLAADGVVFDNHYDTTAICMASRANIVTGMYEYRTGCNFGKGDLPAELWEQSYPMLLRKAGYLTAFAGKFGMMIEGKGLPHDDFDASGIGPGQTNYATKKNKTMAQYADKYPHATLSYGAFSQDFIERATEEEKPFCISISFKAPHRPVDPDPKFDHVYAGKKFTKPANYGRKHGEHFSEQSKQGRQFPRHESWGYQDNYDEVMAKYYQQIYAIDYAVGMIREGLKEHGAAENTVIIYTSDNGFFCGSHGYGSKVLPYEESARVPLVYFDPRHASAGKKQRVSGVTGNIDFQPTILQLAGVDVPENTQGLSLLPLLDNPDGDIRDGLALMNCWGPTATQCLGVVTRDWKYIFWPSEDKGMTATEELFDMKKDKLELTNHATNPERQPQLVEMREKYDAELDRLKETVVSAKYKPYGVYFDRNIPWAEKKGKATGDEKALK